MMLEYDVLYKKALGKFKEKFGNKEPKEVN